MALNPSEEKLEEAIADLTEARQSALAAAIGKPFAIDWFDEEPVLEKAQAWVKAEVDKENPSLPIFRFQTALYKLRHARTK